MRVPLWFFVAGCGDPTVAPPSHSPSEVTAPAPPRPVPVDAAACAAGMQKGAELGTWEGSFNGDNNLKLHLYRSTAADPAAPIGPGLEVVGWADLRVGNLEKLLDLPATGDVPDPGPLCAQALDTSGATKPGKVYKADHSEKYLALVLTAPLPAEMATRIWGAPALAPFTAGEGSRLVPGYDRRPDGKSYLMLRFGDLGGHGYPPALEPAQRLRGDVVVSLVDADGRAIYETHHVQ